MSLTIDVFVLDDTTSIGVANARVTVLSDPPGAIARPIRTTSGDGGVNLWKEGPAFPPGTVLNLAIDAAGYAPFATAAEQPIVPQQDGHQVVPVRIVPFV